MSGIVFFDIDGVLFDPEKFGKLIRAEFVKILNISEDDLIRANADYYSKLESSTDFNPNDIAQYLASKFGTDVNVLKSVFWENDAVYKGSIFEDVEDVLKKLSQSGTLGVFSQGNLELQTRKLEAGGIKKYFNEDIIFIRERKLSDEAVALLPQGATVIDNKHDVVEALSRSVNVVWLNRKTGDRDPRIKTVHTLTEIA